MRGDARSASEASVAHAGGEGGGGVRGQKTALTRRGLSVVPDS
jgi:hypothetical protein